VRLTLRSEEHTSELQSLDNLELNIKHGQCVLPCNIRRLKIISRKIITVFKIYCYADIDSRRYVTAGRCVEVRVPESSLNATIYRGKVHIKYSFKVNELLYHHFKLNEPKVY
jgi:hypothetical protein